MSLNNKLPKKVSLKPKRHHGFQVFLFLLGFLLPPLAVAARFGIGSDLLINIILCICGYFPCHIHNFYIQNIRNNSNRARTPKWAIKAGLVDNSDNLRRERKSQWAKRYDERNPHSTHIGQSLEEGEEGDNYTPSDPNAHEERRNEGLWQNDDEEFYNPDEAPNQRHWSYPANFNGTVGDGRSKRRNQPASGDRWERTRAARSNTVSSSNSSSGYPPAAATDDDVPEWGRDYGSKRRSSKKKTNKNTTAYVNEPTRNGGGGGYGNGSANGAGGYGREFDDGWNDGAGRSNGVPQSQGQGQAQPKRADGDIFSHEF